MTHTLTPSKAAYKLTHVLDTFADAHGSTRFPVDVAELALNAASLFGWKDSITQVQAADIKNFEGALFSNDDRSEWCLLYNNAIKSNGRIRFTQAHELGHYILHRHQKDSFNCSEDDVVNRDAEETSIEAQADTFAATLLMPLNDFRDQVGTASDLESLGACAERYGTSLTATVLRWLKDTDQQAVLINHRDGYMRWAYSSKAAKKNGAFFRSRKQIIEIPENSIAANESITSDRSGTEVSARVWFPHAPPHLSLREMKITSGEYDTALTLLVLPRGSTAWPPFDGTE